MYNLKHRTQQLHTNGDLKYGRDGIYEVKADNEITAYKKVLCTHTMRLAQLLYKETQSDTQQQFCILELSLPADTKVAKSENSLDRYFRSSQAKITNIYPMKSEKEIGKAWIWYTATNVRSLYDEQFKYPPVGEIVTPTSELSESTDRCAPGIHFTVEKKEAEEY